MSILTKLSNYRERAAHKLKYHFRRAAYSFQLPALDEKTQPIIEQLNREGVCLTTLNHLTPAAAVDFWQTVTKVLPKVPLGKGLAFHGERHAASHSVCLDHGTLLKEATNLYLWGLHPVLMRLVEYHLRQPVAYLGAMLRRDVPDHGQVGNRLWHLDGEDHKVIKVIVYLNDVDRTGGAFEYIPKRLTPHYRDFKSQSKSTLIRDEEMQRVCPQQQWQACIGPKGTVIIADTTSVFHHGKQPERDRLTMMYAYTSKNPKQRSACHKFFPYSKELLQLQLAHQSTADQLAAAIYWRN